MTPEPETIRRARRASEAGSFRAPGPPRHDVDRVNERLAALEKIVMARTEATPEDARLIVLGSLERQALTGATEGDVSRELSSIDERSVSARALSEILHGLVKSGHSSVEGSPDLRVYTITETGRAKLREGRAS